MDDFDYFKKENDTGTLARWEVEDISPRKKLRRWVIKAGSQMVCGGGPSLMRSWMEQVATLRREHGIEVIWVTSGAIASAVDRISFSKPNRTLEEKQALSAIGQPIVMENYYLALGAFGLRGAQILLTADDLAHADRRANFENTLEKLLQWGITPILNENDAIATDEIKFGDNDSLSANVARVARAERLIILTDVPGLYDVDPKKFPSANRIARLDSVSAKLLESVDRGPGSSRGTGGMYSKLSAANEANLHGILTWLVQGDVPSVLISVAQDGDVGTRIGSQIKSAPVEDQLRSVRKAARVLRSLPSELKNRVLASAAQGLKDRARELLVANAEDLAALTVIADAAFRDRLTLNDSRLEQMQESLRQVGALVDCNGQIVEQRTLENGLRVSRMRSPLGVIFMIFESRPNVAVEAFSLAFKAGNAIILRGGKESHRTTAVIYDILGVALEQNGVSRDCLWGITDPDRNLVKSLLQQKDWIDVVVPRGGEALIDFVTRNSRIPIIKNDRGMCHVYVHEDADMKMAEEIVENAKTQRPGVCNAMETLLVHEKIAANFLPALHRRLSSKGVQWIACPSSLSILDGFTGVSKAGPQSWDTEYLSLRMNCLVVSSLDEAIAHIDLHGSRHSDAIVTSCEEAARRFQAEVDAAAVYWNASTRFTDGFTLGLGGELGISTQKLHVRGPVGLHELTSIRWVMEGSGQTRT
jgi:glutamate-5-semialdehyde dehydrogenase